MSPATTTSSRPPPKRANSGPFYRKAVPHHHDDDDETMTPTLVVANANHHHVARHRRPPPHDDDATTTTTAYDAVAAASHQRSDHNPSTLDDDHDKVHASSLERHLRLVDLVAIGVGGTVGSGLFVLTGLVARKYAGPATALSWCASGAAACLSGCCYAELSARIPLAGLAYAYTYVALGEVFAVVAAACLSLEYICASAAVARAWGDKTAEYLRDTWPDTTPLWLLPNTESSSSLSSTLSSSYNPLAFCIAVLCVSLLLCGVKESKQVTNFFTSLKITLVVLMVGVALAYTRPTHWIPWAPYGVTGITQGATRTFFGYLGYDQVCCLAGEVQDAKRNLPRAVLGVLAGCAALYVLAALALTGMIPYDQISIVAGFPNGFAHVGATWVAQITALGEIITMPIVMLVTVMVQPRLQYAMAVDGLLPPWFAHVNSQGNLFIGTAVAGSLFVLVSTVVPFEKLNDMISCAVLMALSLTDSCVVMLWHEPAHDPDSPLACVLLMVFHAAALVGSLSLTHHGPGLLTTACGLVLMTSCTAISYYCPRTACFGGRRKHYHQHDLLLSQQEQGYFQTPLVPFLPCLAIAINWWLIAQLEWVGIGLLLGYLALAVLYYLLYAQYHAIGNIENNNNNKTTIELEQNDVPEARETTGLVQKP